MVNTFVSNPNIQYSMTIAVLLMFGVKTEIAITGVHSKVRESLAQLLI